MAGIAAVLGRADAAHLGTRMLRCMDARGPAARVWLDLPDGGLGATAGGDDVPGRAGAWTVALGGAPTNIRSLRMELHARGLVPADATAGQVAAAVFGETGFRVGLRRLEGPISAVAWDATRRTLWLARDPQGVCPLHWSRSADGARHVASDLHPFAQAGLATELDARRVGDLAVVGIPLGPGSVLAGVTSLAPGEILCLPEGGDAQAEQVDLGAHPTGSGGAAKRWAHSLELALRLVLRQGQTDEPILAGDGAFARGLGALSEGLPVLRAEELPLQPADVEALLDELLPTLGEPVVDPTLLTWANLARAAAARGADSLLTGLGGAAAFSPPPRRRRDRLLGQLGAPRPLPAGWARASSPAFAAHPGAGAAVDRIAARVPTRDPDSAALWLARQLLPVGAYAAAERAAAAFGLRLHAPLMDPRLVALAVSVPLDHHRDPGPRGLYLAATGLSDAPAPAPIPAPPLAEWLRGPLHPMVDDLPGRTADLADPTYTRALVDGHRRGEFDAAGRLWGLHLVDRWRRVHMSTSRADTGRPTK